MRSDLARWRLGPQLLAGSTLTRPDEVVRHFGAVQSQEHLWAPWAIGRRCGATFTQVLDGLWPAGVVRTHVLRTTWHYVHADDLPFVIAATSDRVMGALVSHMRRAGLIRRVGTGGQQAPAGPDLQGVGIDHRAALRLGDAQRQRGLARSGRPGDQHRPVRRDIIQEIQCLASHSSS